MELQTYIAPRGAASGLARKLKMSPAYLYQLATKRRPVSPELAVAIERESGNAVRRWELRPTDWHRIWPELVKAKGAPAVDVAKAA